MAASSSARDASDQSRAAATIQKNYRGYRSRRQLNGQGMDAASKWVELVQEAQYRQLIRPRSHDENANTSQSPGPPQASLDKTPSIAKQKWTKARKVTQRAHMDDTSESSGDDSMSPEQRAEHRRKKAQAKREREQLAKDMGLEYWLEMVDEKHRYGSHLRAYHAVWKKADTKENFFEWLDYGEGLHVDTEKCSREVLDRDQVRYLSREQRLQYLVKFDDQGRLRWAKNQERVTTSPDYIDDGEGIVRRPTQPVDGEQKSSPLAKVKKRLAGHHDDHKAEDEQHSESDVSSGDDNHQPPSSTKGRTTVPPAAIFEHLLHGHGQTSGHAKKNTWIFVADTSFRLYIGMKQSGSFQHSSFLHGARISAAGQIKIKDGQIRKLSPLSGHYRPPVSNFRAFVHSLKEAGADLGRCNIPQSYAVVVGVENYSKVKGHTTSNIGKLQHKFEKLFKPEEARKKEEAEMDRSESARKEAEFLARQKEEEDLQKRESWKRVLPLRDRSGQEVRSQQQQQQASAGRDEAR